MQQDTIDAVGASVAAYCVCSMMRVLFGSPPFDLLDALWQIAAFSTIFFWQARKFQISHWK